MRIKREIWIAPDLEHLIEHLYQKWVIWGRKILSEKHIFTCAFSGGKSPQPFFQRLAAFSETDFWARTHIFQVDERFVPFDHPESNGRVIYETLLKPVKLPRTNIHLIPTHADSVEKAAAKYEQELKSFFPAGEGPVPAFDFILLGIGEDGHTASLFPSSLQLKEKDQLVVAVSCPSTPPSRISLSLSILNQAREVCFLVHGQAKANILKVILEEERSLPASLVAPASGQLSFFCDQEAASQLTSQKIIYPGSSV